MAPRPRPKGMESTHVRILPAPAYEPPGVPAGRQAADLLSVPTQATSVTSPATKRARHPVAVPDTTVEARAFALSITKQVFEVVDRRRSATHLTQRVASRLLDQLGVLARTNVTRPGGAPASARLRRVHLQMSGPAAAEIFGTYERGRRVRAFAGRIEHVPCRVRPSTGRYQFAPARIEHRWQLVAFTLA
ncbi:Rv3235 family protein [Gordonia sinesedis]